MGSTRVWLEGGGRESVVLSGFQKLQREKQIKVSPPSGNKGEVKGQEGQRREEEVPKVLTGTSGLSLAQRRLESPCPSTLRPQPSLPIDHTYTLLLAAFIFLVTDRQLDGWGDGQDNTSNRDWMEGKLRKSQ